MNFPKPLGNKLIVEPIPKEDEQVGKIIIPGTTNANLESGKIVALSGELTNFHIGETVIFAKGSGVGDMINGKSYLWLQSTEIWAIDDEAT